jgi:phytanoyl-CoA hydroxylase
MLGTFLRPDAKDIIARAWVDKHVKRHALEVIEQGYTIVRGAIPKKQCEDTIADFRRLEAANADIFDANRDAKGHYPRIVSLHWAMPSLVKLFTRNKRWLATQDLLFGARTALYTSLFYETGSQQAIHRDSPLFCTRPEYLYFGSTVYLERADDENGCLEVLEGAHKLPELDRETIALQHYGSLDEVQPIDDKLWHAYQNSVAAQAREHGIIPKRLTWSPATASFGIRNSRTAARRSRIPRARAFRS